MRKAVEWMAKNHVAANLLMLVFVVGGLINVFSIKQEVFPEMDLDRVKVAIAYPGAGPEEVEEGIILKIEDNLTGIDGIKEIDSVASEGNGLVVAEIRSGEDINLILQDIKNEVDRITTFPEDAEKPVVSKIENKHEVISIVVYGEASERALREHAERIRDELLAYPEITQIELGGVRPYEISIEIPEENLRKYNLTLSDVARLVRRASLDLPAGDIKTKGGEILLRTKEKKYSGTEYAEITAVAKTDGTLVRLGDIAKIRDGFEDADIFAEFDGKPSAMVKVFRVGEQTPKAISRIVRDYVELKKVSIPDSIHLALWNDSSELLQSRMDLLLKNARLGLVLVLITLGLFLEIRLALWVMLGVPISFLGALFIMPALGVSINMISLFAFILTLGILVDDAIIVGENIHEHRQSGKPFVSAAVDGVREMVVPVSFSVLTTIAAFAPLAFVQGVMGKFLKSIPLVAIPLLAVSLIESLFILPAHLSKEKSRKPGSRIIGFVDKIRVRFGRGMDKFASGPYKKFLSNVISYRYCALAAGVSLLFLSVGLATGGILQFTFMPEVDSDIIIASLTMPPGTPFTETKKIQEMIVTKAFETAGDFDGNCKGNKSILSNIFAISGGTLEQGGPTGGFAKSASNIAEIALCLIPGEERNLSSEIVSNRWMQKVGDIPGADSLTFNSKLVHIGADIDIQAVHNDFSVLEKVATQIKGELSKYPGVTSIKDNLLKGKKELKIRLKPEARTLGITEADLADQIRSAFYGAEALRLQIGRNEIKVMVRYPEDERKDLFHLDAMRIRTPEGGEIPITSAAQIIMGRGFSEINRVDSKRVIDVTASVDSSKANAGDILEDINSGLLSRLKIEYPGIKFDFSGEEKEQRETIQSMKDGFLLSLFVIYALMAIPLKSYTQPFLIMTSIPFGIVGAVMGHLLMGYDFCILSTFGVIALTGVVVNDSLLVIYTVNSNRKKGQNVLEASLNACQRRFRPVLLTSLTTFFGLTPMILETSFQAQFLIPMAISLGFGILFATGITLLFLPALYMVLEDCKGLVKAREDI